MVSQERQELVRRLREMPHFRISSAAKRRIEERLRKAGGVSSAGQASEQRTWVLFATESGSISQFADSVVSRGPRWKPVVVSPARLPDAVRSFQPAAVVLDADLARLGRLARQVTEMSLTDTVILTSAELRKLRA